MQICVRWIVVIFVLVYLSACNSQALSKSTDSTSENTALEPISTDLPSSLPLIGMPVVGEGVVFTVVDVIDDSGANEQQKSVIDDSRSSGWRGSISVIVRIKNTSFPLLEITPDLFLAVDSKKQRYFSERMIYKVLTSKKPFLPQGAQELLKIPFFIDVEDAEPITFLYTVTKNSEPLLVSLEHRKNLQSQILPDINLETVLITDIDLEFGVAVGEFSTELPASPHFMASSIGIEQPNYYATQVMENSDDMMLGIVNVFVYDLVETVDALYTNAEQNILFTEKQEIDQLGEMSLLAETPDAKWKQLSFTRCHGFVSITSSLVEADQNWSNEKLISYAKNLDKRLMEQLCP